MDEKKGTRVKKLKPVDNTSDEENHNEVPLGYEVEQIKGSKVTARRGAEVKRMAKNIKSVQPRPQFFQVPLRRTIWNMEEEDLEGSKQESGEDSAWIPGGGRQGRADDVN